MITFKSLIIILLLILKVTGIKDFLKTGLSDSRLFQSSY